MKNTLISMTDFVFLMRENKKKDNIRRFWTCERYAKFLSMPLTLGMFVPTDEEGNVLKFDYPQNKVFDDVAQIEFEKQHQKALDNIIFEGCFDFKSKENFKIWLRDNELSTIESMCGMGLEIYKSAIIKYQI